MSISVEKVATYALLQPTSGRVNLTNFVIITATNFTKDFIKEIRATSDFAVRTLLPGFSLYIGHPGFRVHDPWAEVWNKDGAVYIGSTVCCFLVWFIVPWSRRPGVEPKGRWGRKVCGGARPQQRVTQKISSQVNQKNSSLEPVFVKMCLDLQILCHGEEKVILIPHWG